MVTEASTIHRALGVFPDNPTRYRRGPEQRLRADVVIVDEASMVDLALMRHLCEALKPGARLILLGDRHQLASVEAGSVLAELCGELSPRSATVELRRSFRFAEGSGISELSQAMKEGDAARCASVLKSGRQDLAWHMGVDDPARSDALRQLVVAKYRAALGVGGAAVVLAALSGFRVLCAHRRGRFGVEVQNAVIASWLVEAGVIPREARLSPEGSRRAQFATETFYRGRPILITENDYGLGLHNGDVGIVWPDGDGKLSVAVTDEAGSLRWLSPAQLPAHETAFALTIHKSQGSEYGEVAVILPDDRSPLLSRELVYTGVTRARHKVHLFGEEAALLAAASQSVVRHSGLRSALAARLPPLH
jgi:exodeoxyribonuclease V alpha subunit